MGNCNDTRPETKEEELKEADEEYAELMAFLECFDPAAWSQAGE